MRRLLFGYEQLDELLSDASSGITPEHCRYDEVPVGSDDEPVYDALQQYVNGHGDALLDLPVDLMGVSPFRQRVLRACRRIPAGRVMSYQQLARQVGSPQAARAVGSAMATNPIPLIIPCHRVVAQHRQLGGFSAPGGCVTKGRLLELEGHEVRSSNGRVWLAEPARHESA